MLKRVGEIPIMPEHLDPLDWTAVAVLAFCYGRAAANSAVTMKDLHTLSDAEDPDKEIREILDLLAEGGLLKLPHIVKSPVDVPIRPIIPGGSDRAMRRTSPRPGRPEWATRTKLWGLWLPKALPEHLVTQLEEVGVAINESSHSGDLEKKLIAQERRVELLREWMEFDPSGRVESTLKDMERTLVNERVNLMAYRLKHGDKNKK